MKLKNVKEVYRDGFDGGDGGDGYNFLIIFKDGSGLEIETGFEYGEFIHNLSKEQVLKRIKRFS